MRLTALAGLSRPTGLPVHLPVDRPILDERPVGLDARSRPVGNGDGPLVVDGVEAALVLSRPAVDTVLRVSLRVDRSRLVVVGVGDRGHAVSHRRAGAAEFDV